MYDFFYGPTVPEINYSILFYSISLLIALCTITFVEVVSLPNKLKIHFLIRVVQLSTTALANIKLALHLKSCRHYCMKQ